MIELKGGLFILVTTLSYALGGWDNDVKFLTYAIIFDYIVGVVLSIYEGSFCPMVGFKGFVRKLGYYIVVAISVNIESLLNQPNTIHTAICYMFIINESLSALRNLKVLGVPVPKFLEDRINSVKREDK